MQDAERILIVDDQPDDVELATLALSGECPGCVIEVARSAEDGLSKAASLDFALILLDNKLPGQSGLDALPEFRQLAPEAGIIMLTGHGDERVAVHAMRAGADYYLPKSRNFLLEVPLVVREVLEKRHLRFTLASTEDRYRRLIENMADIVYELDEAGRFRYISLAVAAVLGFLPEEMIGVHYSRFFHPEDVPRCGRRFHERRTGIRATRQLEVRLVTKAGELRDVEVSAAGVYDRQRRFHATAGIARDCTARKEAEQDLTHALSLLRATLESTSDGILVLDNEGKLEIGNGRLARMWDIPESVLTSGEAPRILGVIAEQVQDPADIRAQMQALSLQPDAETREVWALNDGRIVECSTQPQRLGAQCVGRVWSFRDMTETHKAEAALRARTEQLQAIDEAMTEFLEDGNMRASSARLLRAAVSQTQSEYGFIGVVVEGTALRILAHEGIVWDSAINRDFYEQALRTYREQGYLEFTSFENLFGRVITSGQPVVANDPPADPRSGGLPPGHPPLRAFLGIPILRGTEVVGMIGVANRRGGYAGSEQAAIEILTQAAGVLFDSVRRQQREVALEAQLLRAQKMEAVGQLAGGIAHDFNNLLTPILGYAQRLARTLPEGGPQAKEVHIIIRSAARAAELTAQLLTFSRQQAVEPRVLDLNRHVATVEGLLRRTIGEHILLTVLPGKGLGPVKADPGQLEQVILNLVLNARDAMPTGGRLTLATQNVDAGAVPDARGGPFDSAQGRPYVRLSITDTGPGMSEEIQARVFEPFFTTKDVGKGTGLGLAIVDGIIKKAGGFIEIDSAVGRGTTFHVYLPRVEAAPMEGEADLSPTECPGGTETILLVEDEDAVRGFVLDILQSLGYTVLEAADGPAAEQREADYQGPIHLLVTDVVMPTMSGWELVRALRRRRPSLRVLLMSGYPAVSEGEQEMLDEEVELLRKPFAADGLAQRVRRILDGA